jgi:hypothetical protein
MEEIIIFSLFLVLGISGLAYICFGKWEYQDVPINSVNYYYYPILCFLGIVIGLIGLIFV